MARAKRNLKVRAFHCRRKWTGCESFRRRKKKNAGASGFEVDAWGGMTHYPTKVKTGPFWAIVSTGFVARRQGVKK